MATLLLSAVGNAIFPGFGQVLGAIVGSYVDNNILFPPPGQKGPRYDGQPLSAASEGRPITKCIGQENRVEGTVIWRSPIRETEHEQGKGGPSAQSYTYSCDFAVLFCEGPIDGIDRMWADGNLFYDDTPEIQVVSNQLTATDVNYYRPLLDSQVLAGSYLDISSPAGGPDLSVFQSGLDVVVSGWSNANDNGTFRCVSATIDSAGATVLRLKNDNAVSLGSGSTITLTQTPPKYDPATMGATPTIYTGTTTQTADPTIVSFKGAANVQAHRGLCYVLLHDYQLGNFPHIPKFDAMVRESSAPRTVGDAISQHMLRAGRRASEFDVSACTATLRGYRTSGPQSPADALRTLLIAFDILTQEDNAVIRFFPRAQAEVVVVDADDLASHDVGADADRPFSMRDTETARLPGEINVTHCDPSTNYQRGEQRFRGAKRAYESVQDLDLSNLVLSSEEAMVIAKRVFWTAHANRWAQTLALPPSRLDVLENDVLELSGFGKTIRALASKVDLGANFQLAVEAVKEEAQTLTQTATGAEPEGTDDGSSGIHYPPETILELLGAIGPLREEEVEQPGFYWAGAYAGPDVVFRGAQLYESTDGGSNYGAGPLLEEESTLGWATSALASGGTHAWDWKNTVSVQVANGTLASATELEVLNGANRAIVGGEVIAFQTATLTATNKYTLSGLLRGLRGTGLEAATAHLAGERFILLSSSSLRWRPADLASYNATRLYKLPAYGGTLAQYASQSYALSFPTLRQFPPCAVQSFRDPSGGGTSDLLIRWKGRTRGMARVFGGTPMPVYDTDETYELDIWNTAETLLKATLTITGAQETTLTAAYLTGLGLTPANPVHCKLFAVSSIVGRSKDLGFLTLT